jgi:hydroxyacylglutathione hydrolase
MRIHTFTLGPFQTNSYLLEDQASHTAILVDPTIGSESILHHIQTEHLQVPLILNTHSHVDHVYGNAFFKEKLGAQILIHAADAPALLSLKEHAMMFGLDVPPSPPADRLLQDGDTVTAGGLSFQAIHTPGHTPGGMCLYGYNVLITGDTLFAGSIGRTDLPGGDYDTLMDSIRRRLLTLPDQTLVYSGHGDETTIGVEKKSNPFLE